MTRVDRPRPVLALAFAALGLLSACAVAPRVIEPPQVRIEGAVTSEQFLTQAHDLALRGRSFSSLAADQATDPTLVAYAAGAAAELETMIAELTVLARSKGIEALEPTEETAQARAALADLSGPEFDAVYREQMQAIFDAMGTLADAAYASSADPGIRSFIRDWQPVLEEQAASVPAPAG